MTILSNFWKIKVESGKVWEKTENFLENQGKKDKKAVATEKNCKCFFSCFLCCLSFQMEKNFSTEMHAFADINWSEFL